MHARTDSQTARAVRLPTVVLSKINRKPNRVRSGPVLVLENTKKNQNSDSAVLLRIEFCVEPPFSNFDLDQKKFFIEIR